MARLVIDTILSVYDPEEKRTREFSSGGGPVATNDGGGWPSREAMQKGLRERWQQNNIVELTATGVIITPKTRQSYVRQIVDFFED